MKPAPFAYHAPSSVADALDAISRADDPEDLKVLAGGQSLVPMLNLRLAQPGTLLDINGLEWEWGSIELDPTAIRVGALVRQRAAERSAAVTQWCPLLAEARRGQADGREITTVEGLSPSALLNPLQEAMRDSHAFTATNGVTGQFQVLRSTGGLAHRGELAENVAVLAELFPAVLRGKPKAMAGQLSGGSGRWSRSRSPWPAGPRSCGSTSRPSGLPPGRSKR
jgi:hypothetical protein